MSVRDRLQEQKRLYEEAKRAAESSKPPTVTVPFDSGHITYLPDIDVLQISKDSGGNCIQIEGKHIKSLWEAIGEYLK